MGDRTLIKLENATVAKSGGTNIKKKNKKCWHL